jgi:spore cortex formation protein SpoVR/YcgB (stage V sporulation)
MGLENIVNNLEYDYNSGWETYWKIRITNDAYIDIRYDHENCNFCSRMGMTDRSDEEATEWFDIGLDNVWNGSKEHESVAIVRPFLIKAILQHQDIICRDAIQKVLGDELIYD